MYNEVRNQGKERWLMKINNNGNAEWTKFDTFCTLALFALIIIGIIF